MYGMNDGLCPVLCGRMMEGLSLSKREVDHSFRLNYAHRK